MLKIQLNLSTEADECDENFRKLFTTKAYLPISNKGLIIISSLITKITALCTTDFQRNPAAQV